MTCHSRHYDMITLEQAEQPSGMHNYVGSHHIDEAWKPPRDKFDDFSDGEIGLVVRMLAMGYGMDEIAEEIGEPFSMNAVKGLLGMVRNVVTGTKECVICGKEFFPKPGKKDSHKDRKTCSPECLEELGRQNARKVGDG